MYNFNQYEFEKLKRQIEILKEIVNLFENIDCNLKNIDKYSSVYCKHFKKFSKNDLILLISDMESKKQEFLKKEFKKTK